MNKKLELKQNKVITLYSTQFLKINNQNIIGNIYFCRLGLTAYSKFCFRLLFYSFFLLHYLEQKYAFITRKKLYKNCLKLKYTNKIKRNEHKQYFIL